MWVTAPWHKLGVKLPKLATSTEAIEAAGLDYEVEKKPLFCKPNGRQLVEVPKGFCTIRTDTEAVLGLVGERYTVLQNKDAFTFFDSSRGIRGRQSSKQLELWVKGRPSGFWRNSPATSGLGGMMR